MPTPIDKTASNVRRWYAQNTRDFAVSGSAIKERFGLAEVERYCSTRLSPVHVLLTSRCPPAIIRRVAFVIVDAVKRQTYWPFTHVSEEVSEIAPPFTNGDASTAVVIKAVVARVAAAVDHTKPRSVGAASLTVSRVSVFGAIVEFGHGDLLQRFAASSGGQTLQGLAVAITVS